MQIISAIKDRKICSLSRERQRELALESFEMVYKMVQPVIDGDLPASERDSAIDPHNPLIWSFGHILYFWELFFCRFVYPHGEYPMLEGVDELYDSFKCGENKYTSRFSLQIHDTKTLADYMDRIWVDIERWIVNSKKQAHYENYAFMTCLLHTHMHLEAYLFDYQMLCRGNPLASQEKLTDNNPQLSLELVAIDEGEFMQGAPNDGKGMVWDNELSRFKVFVKKFWLSKHPVTQGQFLNFVRAGGYENQDYWSVPGLAWLKKTHSKNPVYWKLDDDQWYRRLFDQWVLLEVNYPMVHVNYYEAEAFCKWAGGRLMTESEWEYVATEGGENNGFGGEGCNLGYDHGDVRPVTDDGLTKWGVSNMMGNAWCWCKDVFYPYPDYNIEPLYREFSYPFFGYKHILRGGCWAVPDILISKFYRNAQPADMRKQFTGFRLVREFRESE